MLQAGTILTCPSCGAEQIKSTVDLLPGGQMKDAKWESLGFDLESQRAGCYKCGDKFTRQHPTTGKTQVHTNDNGWVALSKTKPQENQISEPLVKITL